MNVPPNTKPFSLALAQAPGITLEEFISLKPKELRLGQFFVNSYLKPTNGHWEQAADILWNADGAQAKQLICQLMTVWQWSTLPEIIKK